MLLDAISSDPDYYTSSYTNTKQALRDLVQAHFTELVAKIDALDERDAEAKGR